jgi:hypothetical protein
MINPVYNWAFTLFLKVKMAPGFSDVLWTILSKDWHAESFHSTRSSAKKARFILQEK